MYDPIADEMEHQERHLMQLRIARARMAARFAPGGDKHESIKADEQWERVENDRIQAEEERLRMMGIVDISEQEN